jgi:cytochrome P450
MMNDERRASFHSLAKDTQLGAVVGRHNFAQDLHASVIRRKLETERARVLPAMADVVSQAVDHWLEKNPLSDTHDVSGSLTHLMAYVMSRVCLGSEGFDDPELIEAYIGLNTDSGTVFQVSNLLPSFIARIFSDIKVHKHYAIIKKKILPIIHQRRKLQTGASVDEKSRDLLGFFLDVTDDATSVAELVAGITIGGLINVSVGVTNGLYDIAGVPGLQREILSDAPPDKFVPDRTSSGQWDKLRSAVLETLRLSACVFGPVRKIIVKDFKLGSDPRLVLPKGSGIAASPYLVHYDNKVYPNASEYRHNRFTGANDAVTGSAQYVTFGLPPHTCPGRFFAIQTVAIALNSILKKYDVELRDALPPGDRYTYLVGEVVMPRKPLALRFARR